MSEWKEGDKGYVEAVVAANDSILDPTVFVKVGGQYCGRVDKSRFIRSIPPQPAPVDVSQIKVGDEVAVKANVVDVYDDELPFLVSFDGDCIWVRANEIASHTPSRPPSTLAEFKALTEEQQERWFNEMKGKVAT